MNEERTETGKHLTDAELFALAAPATGEPEALPEHLSQCRDCARALREWNLAMGAVGDADAGALERRSPEEWRAREEETMAAIRRRGRPHRPLHAWRWALAAAASLLIAVLVLTGRRATPVAAAARAASTPKATASAPASTDLSAADAADDALLREASFLASGGDVDAEGLAGRL
jgi:predicted anti-sigma-YlaC factor YlaD